MEDHQPQGSYNSTGCARASDCAGAWHNGKKRDRYKDRARDH